MAAVEERAKENLKEEMRENVSHVPVDCMKAESDQIRNFTVLLRSGRRRSQFKKVVPSHMTSRKRKLEVTDLDSNIFRSKKTKTNNL